MSSITGNSENIFVNNANLKIVKPGKGIIFADGSVFSTAPPNSDSGNTAYFSNGINAFVITETTANTGFAGNTAPTDAISVSSNLFISYTGNLITFGQITAGSVANVESNILTLESDLLDNSSRIGLYESNVYLSGGNVGIGTSTPSANLQVDGNVYVTTNVQIGGFFEDGTLSNLSANIVTLESDLLDNSSIIGRYESNVYLSGGNVGIGTTSPEKVLDVNGDAQIRYNNGGGYGTVSLRLNHNAVGQGSGGGLLLQSQAGSGGIFHPEAVINTWKSGVSHEAPLVFKITDVEKMRLLTNGNVGISNTSPNHELSVNGNVYASGNYLPFTGAHISLNTLSSYEDGTLVASTGNVSADDTVYNTSVEIEPTSVSKDKRVIGVICNRETEISDGESNAEPNTYTITTTQIIALGEGRMLVCNENGDIENGDYICSSNVVGHGMRQDDDLLHNYTVAKATETCSFTGPDDKKLVSVTFHCG